MMSTSKQFSMSVAAVAIFALLAAACGDSTSTTIGADPSTSAPVATPTLAAPLGAGPYPIADMSVVVHPDGVKSAPSATYRINCLGDTANASGDAPAKATEICMSLAAPTVRDVLINGAPADRICTEIYGGPNVAVFTGTLDGIDISFTANRVNGCAINDWDSVLSQLLP